MKEYYNFDKFAKDYPNEDFGLFGSTIINTIYETCKINDEMTNEDYRTFAKIMIIDEDYKDGIIKNIIFNDEEAKAKYPDKYQEFKYDVNFPIKDLEDYCEYSDNGEDYIGYMIILSDYGEGVYIIVNKKLL